MKMWFLHLAWILKLERKRRELSGEPINMWEALRFLLK